MMIVDAKRDYEYIKRAMLDNRFLSTPKNNVFLRKFLEAKMNGGYGRLVYPSMIGWKTMVKKARNLSRVDEFFRKDFDSITEDELLHYRDLLNENFILAKQTMVKHEPDGISFEIIETDKPISYRTKEDYKINFVEFYRFMIEYIWQTEKREISDITRFFKLRRPTDFQEVVVNYIPQKDLPVLLNNIKNRDFRSMVQLCVMSAARPCEIINVRYGQKHNLYKNDEGKWIIHLPKIKKVSYAKFPFRVDMYEDELYPYFDSLEKKEGELVFRITEQTFVKLMKHYTGKYLKKVYSPKILRKTARMIRTNANYSEQWINKLLGHAPGSRVQGHYINHAGIENDAAANEKMKGIMYPSIKQDYDDMKMKMQAMEERMKTLEEIETMRSDLVKLKSEKVTGHSDAKNK